MGPDKLHRSIAQRRRSLLYGGESTQKTKTPNTESENPDVVNPSEIDTPGSTETILGETAKRIMFEQAAEVAITEETNENGPEKNPNKP